MDRRAFVKGCVGVATVGALGGSVLGQIKPISNVPVDIVPLTYPAIKVLRGSPAPFGLPLIPLRLNSRGEFEGVPDHPLAAKVSGSNQLYWYKYCSHERSPGTKLSFTDDNILRFAITEDKIAKGFNPWYRPHLDQPVKPEHFPAKETAPSFTEFPGTGAGFRWRSEGVRSAETITGIIIRTETPFEFDRMTESEGREIVDAFTVEDPDGGGRFVAFCSFCTHFCCVPGFHESPLAVSSNFGDKVFCTCHLSRYDPWVLTKYDRTIFLYPEFEQGEAAPAAEGGGAAAAGAGEH